MPDDDRRAEQLVVIDRRHHAGAGRADRRADRGGQIHARVRAPVLRRGVVLQCVDAVGRLRLAGDRPDADARSRFTDGIVRHGGGRRGLFGGWGGRRGRLAAGRLAGLRILRARGDGQCFTLQGSLFGYGVGYEQPA